MLLRSAVVITIVLFASLCQPARGDILGFGDGSGYTLNSLITPGPSISGGTLTLTTIDGSNQAASAFYDTRQSTGSFTAAFTYQASGVADGIAFVIQNDPNGLNALGSLGSGLGYAATGGNTAEIVNSVALQADFYGFTGGPGTYLGTQGSSGIFNYLPTDPVNFNDPIQFMITYNASAQTLSETLVDTTSPTTTYAHTFTGIDLASEVGSSSAYVGFTGGTGGLSSTQTISGFAFQSAAVPEPGSLTLALVGIGMTLGVWLTRRNATAIGPATCPPAHS
jgi:lectin family protein/PEP-CTERM motif-containing protein